MSTKSDRNSENGSKIDETNSISPENITSEKAPSKEAQDELVPYGLNDETPYGWLNFRPNFIQCCNRIGWFTCFMMLFSFTKFYGYDGVLAATLTTLEKRYNLSSKQSGLLFSTYDMAYIIGNTGNMITGTLSVKFN